MAKGAQLLLWCLVLAAVTTHGVQCAGEPQHWHPRPPATGVALSSFNTKTSLYDPVRQWWKYNNNHVTAKAALHCSPLLPSEAELVQRMSCAAQCMHCAAHACSSGCMDPNTPRNACIATWIANQPLTYVGSARQAVQGRTESKTMYGCVLVAGDFRPLLLVLPDEIAPGIHTRDFRILVSFQRH